MKLKAVWKRAAVGAAALAVLGGWAGCAGTVRDAGLLTALEPELRRLDSELGLAGKYIADHQQRLVTIENMLHSRGVSPEQQYRIYEQLYDASVAFQFDKAMQMLDKQAEIVRTMKDRSHAADVAIRRARLYASAGMFFEAGVLLETEIDTLSLSREQLVAYYDAQQRFHREFSDYTQSPELNRIAWQKVRYYRRRILELTDSDSDLNRAVRIRNHLEAKELRQADSLNRILLSHAAPNSPAYAQYAYDQARICEQMDQTLEQRQWFIRSAIADLRCAIRDNASLCSLAQLLLQDQQVDRAFRYITCSLNDALFYNAKLRPWQIASVIPLIETAYQQARADQEATTRRQVYVISVLACVLALICGYVLYQYLGSRRVGREMERLNRQIEEYNASLSETNLRLEGLNNALSEANAVKEEYIGLFLSICSDYIDKLSAWRREVRRRLSPDSLEALRRELASQDAVNAELTNFYETFDNAFLALYPDFIEGFNGLLKPEARIEPKKGERLNTELRIFALIRLGITDSSRIASLLRYSVNTIYNYRARIKNNALGNRDDFEERLKRLGSVRQSDLTAS